MAPVGAPRTDSCPQALRGAAGPAPSWQAPSGQRAARGSGSGPCKPPGERKSVAREEGGGLRPSSGGTRAGATQQSSMRKLKRGKVFPVSIINLFFAKSKEVGMKNLHKVEKINTHTNSRSIFQEIRSQENHQVRCQQ